MHDNDIEYLLPQRFSFAQTSIIHIVFEPNPVILIEDY